MYFVAIMTKALNKQSNCRCHDLIRRRFDVMMTTLIRHVSTEHVVLSTQTPAISIMGIEIFFIVHIYRFMLETVGNY